ncbi:MAG: PKD domain-containing protein [Verrucomicrobiota bacterium]
MKPTRSVPVLLLASLAAAMSVSSAQNAPEPVFPALNLGKGARGAAIISALGTRLPEVARFYGMTEPELGALCLRDRDLRADRSGRLLYACQGMTAQAPTAQNAGTNALLTYPAAETFRLHSKPGMSRVIYLDFNGHTTSSTSWNTNFTGGAAFTTPVYNTDGNASSFSDGELANIQEIWKRVSEDYAAWDVDVTTEEPPLESLRKSTSTDTAYGIRIVIGGSSYQWLGGGAGGVAYLNSFGWNTDTPAFVFPDQLGNGFPKYVAEATSHEAGHTVALNHDGKTDGTEYYTGTSAWAPIMGVGYSSSLTQFSRGEYAGANNTENDTADIDGFIPRSADLAGDDILTAVPLAGASVSATGIIQSQADADLYRVDTGAGLLSFQVVPANPDANLDIMLALYNGSGNLIASANPATLEASLSLNVPDGTYYLSVDGTGAAGYSDYGSLGQFRLTGSVPSPSGSPPVAAASVIGSSSGLAPLPVSFSSSGSFDPEGSALTYDWDFGDGSTSTSTSIEPNPSHTYTTPGNYTASLVVKDSTGLSGSASVPVTVQSPPVLVYVSNIAMSKTVSKRGTQASAVVTIKDAAGNLKSNASVTGTWSGLTSGTSTVKTGSTGTAKFSSALTKNAGTFTFKVTGVVLGGSAYDASLNLETTDSIVK